MALATSAATLYAAAEARSREIATLRAIGFSGAAAAVSVLAEGLALAIPAAAIGLVGGLFPALRAASRPVTDALRAT